MGFKTRSRVGPFHRFGDRYATMFDPDHFLGRSAFEDSWMAPPANVKKKASTIAVEVALPGFTRDEVKLSVEKDMLQVTAVRNIDESKINELTVEIPDKLIRTFHLKKGMDEKNIEARLENGILKISIPYKDTELKKKEIVIH